MQRVHSSLLFAITLLVSATASANKTHDMLSSRSEEERNRALAQFMERSGERCGQVTRSFFQGMEKKSGKAFWNVRCSNKKSFSIMIYNDRVGSTKIMECSILKAVAGTECFKKF